MIYVYKCPSCSNQFEIVKSYKEIDKEETCPKCSSVSNRIIVPGVSFYGEKDWDNQQWCSALGCYVKSNKHRRQIAKERGLVEVGNESLEKVEKAYAKEREEKAEANYQKAMREITL